MSVSTRPWRDAPLRSDDGCMLPRIPIPQALLDLLAAQRGAISTAQAINCGLTPKAVRRIAREWTTLAPGLHIVGPVTWLPFARAALLRGGPDAALGGAAAAHVLGFVQESPSTITVWSPRRRSPLAHGKLRAVYRRGERHAWGQLRRTSAEATLLDLAGEADEFTLVEGVTRACARGATTPSLLRKALEARERQVRRALIEQLCDAAEDGVESVLEWLFHERVLLAHGFDLPSRQVRSAQGYRVDVWFEDVGVLAELDGSKFHDGDADAVRDNRHAIELGVVTLRFTWRQVLREPCAVARVLMQALRTRGWQGGCRPCPAC